MTEITTDTMETTSNTSSTSTVRGKAKAIEGVKAMYYHAIVLHLEGKAVKAIILSSNTSSTYDVKRNSVLRYDKMFNPGNYKTKAGLPLNQMQKLSMR